jgi:hypothetical protein
MLAGAALAAVPIVYINSTNSMDYLWALAFAMVAVMAAARRFPLAAGLSLGLSAGCRLEYGAVALSLLVFIAVSAEKRARLAAMVKLVLATGASTLLVFSPVLYNLGTRVILGKLEIKANWDNPELAHQATHQAFFQIFGVVGAVVVVALIAFVLIQMTVYRTARGQLLTMTREKKGWLAMCLTGIAVFLYGYWRAPFKAEYLISAIPFIIGCLAVILGATRRGNLAATIGFSAMLLSPFVLDVGFDDPRKVHDIALPQQSALPQVFIYNLNSYGIRLRFYGAVLLH